MAVNLNPAFALMAFSTRNLANKKPRLENVRFEVRNWNGKRVC
jgi:hypothetical protein